MSNADVKVVDKLLEKEEVLRGIEERVAEKKKEFKPFITISREPGSGGRLIAKEVGKRLGFKVYDRELLEEIAKELKISTSVLKKVDEHSRSKAMDFVQGMLNPDYVSDEKYFRILCHVALSLASKGGVIIVGRGANFITPESYGLEVQIVAPYRVRVARAVNFEKIEYLEARERIKDVTSSRERFVKQYFGKDLRQPKYYDITINTAFYTIEKAADVVVAAYKSKFPNGIINRNLVY